MPDQMIHKVIVEDMKGICLVCNPLIVPVTPQKLKDVFKAEKLPIFSFSIDMIGTALVRINKVVRVGHGHTL